MLRAWGWEKRRPPNAVTVTQTTFLTVTLSILQRWVWRNPLVTSHPEPCSPLPHPLLLGQRLESSGSERKGPSWKGKLSMNLESGRRNPCWLGTEPQRSFIHCLFLV